MPWRIGIDSVFIQQRATGSGQYVLNLCRALSQVQDGKEYYLLAREFLEFGEEDDAPLRRWAQASSRPPGSSLSGNLSKVWWEQVTLPALARQMKLDLLHCPYFAGPLQSPCHLVMTIHDVIPLALPVYRGPWWARFYWTLVKGAARRADCVLTDSEASRKDISKYLGVSRHRIVAVPLGVGEELRRPLPSDVVSSVRSGLGLDGDFILYIGGLDARKNVAILLAAMAQVRTESGRPCRLVVVGQPHSTNRRLFPDLASEVRRLGLAGQVVFTGPISDLQRVALYQSATLFVYPSLYEGFGLPPLEAMAAGTPVVASNRSSIPEVVGDAGILVDPTSPAAMAEAISMVLSNQDLQERMRERGRERSHLYTWEKTAAQTLAVYEDILQGRMQR